MANAVFEGKSWFGNLIILELPLKEKAEPSCPSLSDVNVSAVKLVVVFLLPETSVASPLNGKYATRLSAGTWAWQVIAQNMLMSINNKAFFKVAILLVFNILIS
jgi:hypothetical protein